MLFHIMIDLLFVKQIFKKQQNELNKEKLCQMIINK